MKLYTFLLAFFLLTTAVSSAQYVELLSDEALQEAMDAASDSLGSPAVLVGVSAPGPIDLTEIGIPVESEGLSFETGRSSVWGYLFRTEDSTDYIGVIILKDESGGATIMASRDLEFELEKFGRTLKLDESYSRSDAMVERLRADLDFIAFTTEFPGYELRETMLAWMPELPPSVPATFPLGSPIWQVEIMSDGFDSEDITCFISTGSGETFCRRASSGVDDETSGLGGVSVSPNVALIGEEIAVRVSTPERIALLDVTGAVVLDLSSRVGAMRQEGSSEFPLLTDALPSGIYYLYVVANDGTMSMAEIRLTR